MLTTTIIEHVLNTLPNQTIGLVGDLFLDRYLDLDADLTEPSIETGRDAYQVVRVRAYPGALGTVINNLVALGVGCIRPIAGLGDDGEGYELRQALKQFPTVDTSGIFLWPTRRTPTYTKPMLGRRGETAVELNRLDIKNREITDRVSEDRIIELVHQNWRSVGAWIVLDQVSEANCGVITDRVRQAIADCALRDPGKFVLADSREQIRKFRHVTIKPNFRELFANRDEETLGPAERRAATESATALGRAIICTQGEKGSWIFRSGSEGELVPAYPVAGPIDIVGAGDSCTAGITSAITAGVSLEDAVAFGNLVASITIQQLGTTGTATPKQVRERWAIVSNGQ